MMRIFRARLAVLFETNTKIYESRTAIQQIISSACGASKSFEHFHQQKKTIKTSTDDSKETGDRNTCIEDNESQEDYVDNDLKLRTDGSVPYRTDQQCGHCGKYFLFKHEFEYHNIIILRNMERTDHIPVHIQIVINVMEKDHLWYLI